MEKISIPQLAQAINTLKTSTNPDHIYFAKERLEKECNKLPSGSGINMGVELLMDESKPERIVFKVPFHHMDQYGGYSGWTDYKLILKPSFVYFGIDMRIAGRDRNYVKEYLYELFAEIFEL